ncbi:universal stress protein [Sphaerisporangium sp. NPDC005288]|uniref:universal stress protein n=1 Tax=Sphaerisporangium sp. NPDC005288 TaxID=3155114 RepID=UPI0033B24682
MIVVGVDGSPAGFEAARWAAGEAALRGAGLLVAHAMPAWAAEAGAGPYAEVARWMRDGADAILREALDQARRVAPGAEMSHVRLPGDPRAALIEAAGAAELLVVGNHGLGGLRGLLLGSVALGVAGRAPCPVAVVRPVPQGARPQIVTGVDGPGSGEEALRFAFAEAALRQVELVVVHLGNGPGGGNQGPPPAACHRWRELHPEVKVSEPVVSGEAVDVLAEASARAELLVVGSRGRGVLTGLVLGSVSHALLYQALCPVVVLPPPTGPAPPSEPAAGDRAPGRRRGAGPAP